MNNGTFCGLLTLLFIALKILGYIHWSWWWVLSPLWIPLVLFVVVTVITLVFMGVSVSKLHKWMKK